MLCSRSLTRWEGAHLSDNDEGILARYAELLSFRIAMRAFWLVGSYFIGTHIFFFFGISLPVVQVGGGLIVISTGWTLLKQGNDDGEKDTERNSNRKTFPQRFLSSDLALDGGTRIDFRGDHSGRERPAPSRIGSCEHFGRDCRVPSARGQHISLLRFCRPPGKDIGATGMTVVCNSPRSCSCASEYRSYGMARARFWSRFLCTRARETLRRISGRRKGLPQNRACLHRNESS